MGVSSSDGRKMGLKSGIHWRMPTAMIICFLLGLGLAIGHHFYYYSLDDTTVGGQNQQAWALRIGTGMAFLTRTFLTTAVGIACVQNLWWILRLKPVRLSTLDSMWDIRGSIFNFFDPHLWIRGPNVAILGLITWTIPLVTVVTPATLSVQSAFITSYSPQPLLRDFDWDFFKYSTMSDGGVDGPTAILTRFVTGVIIQGSVRTLQAPAPNSSYTHEFIAPLIQCEPGSDILNTSIHEWHRRTDMFRMTYVGFTATTGNISRDLDVLFETTEYISSSKIRPDDEALVGKLVLALQPYSPNRTLVECAMYNASYTVDFHFVNGEQTQEITDMTILNSVPAYTQKQSPKPSDEDKRFSYTAIMSVFSTMFTGRCWYYPQHCDLTQVFSTALGNSKEMLPLLYSDGQTMDSSDLPPLADVAAQLGKNITLSFLSDPYFQLNATNATPINVTTYSYETRYLYSQKNLLIAYGVSVFISLLCIMAGFLTMWDNGFAFSDSFSTILRATRNPKFDEIVPPDSTTGSDPPPESLSRTRVQWVPSHIDVSGREQDGVTVAGLRPLPSLAETEKGSSSSGRDSERGSGGGGRSPRSPIAFANRIRERKNYTATTTVAQVDERSPGGFI
ncbi:hypothetical protein BJY01DRAFT_52962 [Aspergillus pseudoustus]|uniref:Transmembrane protein n=1 Tax=Aspergillus pseudoustus TaxID=1810923 RepID=A0ABR4JAE1_9EURO